MPYGLTVLTAQHEPSEQYPPTTERRSVTGLNLTPHRSASLRWTSAIRIWPFWKVPPTNPGPGGTIDNSPATSALVITHIFFMKRELV